MQAGNDGTHVILPAAVPIGRRPDRAGLPVKLLRQSDEKVRHEASVLQVSSATIPSQSAEDCTAQRDSTPEYRIVTSSIE